MQRNHPKSRPTATTTLLRSPSTRRRKKTLPTYPPSAHSRAQSTSLDNLISTSIPVTLPIPSPLVLQQKTPSAPQLAPPSKTRTRKRKRHDSEKEQQRRKQKKKEIRRVKRAAESRPRGLRDIWLKHLMNAQPIILPDFDITSLPVGPSGFRGCQRPTDRRTFSVEELKQRNFQTFPYNGDTTYVFLDRNRRLVMLLRKRDGSEEGYGRQERMTASLDSARREAIFETERRGSFGVLRDGHIHSGGTWVRVIFLDIHLVLIQGLGTKSGSEQRREYTSSQQTFGRRRLPRRCEAV